MARFYVRLLVCLLIPSVWAGVSLASAPARCTVVFLTKSDACNCVANLCVAGEQEVLNFLQGKGDAVQYRRVDLAEDATAGKKYRAVTLPVVLLLDASGEELVRFDSFFTAVQLEAAWAQYQSRPGTQP